MCNFSVAVNGKKKEDGEHDTDYFRVTAWRGLADICSKYLAKGRKVAVVGSVSLHTYESNGKHGASLEVLAQDVEFLSAKNDNIDQQSGYEKVDVDVPY